MKRQIDKILPDRLRTEASKRLEEYISGIPGGFINQPEKLKEQLEEKVEGKVNIYVNNRNKVRLSEKVLNTNEEAVRVIQEIIKSNNNVMKNLDEGTQINITNSTVTTNGGTGFYIETKQDSTHRERYEYDLEDNDDIWLD